MAVVSAESKWPEKKINFILIQGGLASWILPDLLNSKANLVSIKNKQGKNSVQPSKVKSSTTKSGESIFECWSEHYDPAFRNSYLI